MALRILVVGAGLGGLAAAISIKYENPEHEVIVIESATELAEVSPPDHSDVGRSIDESHVSRSGQVCSLRLMPRSVSNAGPWMLSSKHRLRALECFRFIVTIMQNFLANERILARKCSTDSRVPTGTAIGLMFRFACSNVQKCLA